MMGPLSLAAGNPRDGWIFSSTDNTCYGPASPMGEEHASSLLITELIRALTGKHRISPASNAFNRSAPLPFVIPPLLAGVRLGLPFLVMH